MTGLRFKVRKRAVLALLGAPLLAPLATLATPIAAASPGASPASSFDRGLLWRVDRPGLHNAEAVPAPSHLFGTVHIDDRRATSFSQALRTALTNARTFMPELLPDPESGQRFALATQLQGGLTLASVAGTEVAGRVAALLEARYGMPPDDIEPLKPWAAYLYLSQPPARGGADGRGEIVDAALYRLARARRVAVRPLESVSQQIASLDAVPLVSQVALLDGLARRHDEAMAAVDQLTARYLARDLAGLRVLEEAPAQGDPALRAAMADFMLHMLDRRNERMLRALLPQLELGGVFAAMGALHLQGERGLLALLERAGWRVRRVE